jgi:sugar transferase EpsL
MYPVFKRTLDVCISTLAIILLLPVFLLLGLLICAQIGRPVLFKQQRPGLKAKPFTLLKFRTMETDCDQNGVLLPDDQRLTPLGGWLRAWSLDELPQLFNVLKGDLSLVGPRPLLMEYLPLYSPEQARRHDLRPGITGLAQVKGRNSLSWPEKFQLDVDYVDHVSFLLDTKILFWTLKSVLSREGIHQRGHVTMPNFTGNHHDA